MYILLTFIPLLSYISSSPGSLLRVPCSRYTDHNVIRKHHGPWSLLYYLIRHHINHHCKQTRAQSRSLVHSHLHLETIISHISHHWYGVQSNHTYLNVLLSCTSLPVSLTLTYPNLNHNHNRNMLPWPQTHPNPSPLLTLTITVTLTLTQILTQTVILNYTDQIR